MSLEKIVDLALDPIFCPPSRTGVSSGWWEHVPFAHLLVTQLRPNVIVELGTHNGVSFSAFCDAMQRADVPGRCYAIDTWVGDAQAGFYGDEVYSDLRKFIDLRYKFCAEMIRATFADAVVKFSDASIDILHIDGLHTYDAVKSDFENWLPKLSTRGVVLFHDTNVRDADFGVYRYWDELRNIYPTFEFMHGYGLGVLAVGSECHSFITSLCNLGDSSARALRERLACIGARWTAVADLEIRRLQLAERASKIDELEDNCRYLRDELAQWRRDAKDKSALLNLERQERVRMSATLAEMSDVLRMERIKGLTTLFDPSVSHEQVKSSAEADAALIEASDLFDSTTYAGREQAEEHGLSPALHYLRVGEAAGLTPSKHFDPASYAAANPDVPVDKGLLLHYLRFGQAEGRAIGMSHARSDLDAEAADAVLIESSGLFDTKTYAGRKQAEEHGLSPALHYLRAGEAAGLAPSKHFDPASYAAANPDVPADKGLLLHYLRYGQAEGRAIGASCISS